MDDFEQFGRDLPSYYNHVKVFQTFTSQVDTLMQVLKDDLESIMIEAVRIEPTVDRFSRELVKKSFPNLMRKASSVVKWGTPHIHVSCKLL